MIGSKFENTYVIQCLRNGKLAWEETIKNMVVNQGLDDVLDKYFMGDSYTAEHYLGLKGAGSVSANDTLTSHPGWSELAGYEGNRKKISYSGSVSGQALNSRNEQASTFVINADQSIAGIIVTTVASGTAGKLYGAANFPAVRNVFDGDQLVVALTFTQASA